MKQIVSSPVTDNKEQATGQVPGMQSEVGVEEPQNENNTADQVEDDQANSGASPEDKKTEKVKVEPQKDYKPAYTDEEKRYLQEVTDVVKAEISEAPVRYGAIPFGNNVVISLKKFVKLGGILASPKINRVHTSSDMKATGESLLSHGSQHILLVISAKVAVIAGIDYERFANDPDKDKPFPENALILVLLDGNGRINFLMNLPIEEWPEIYAVFPSADAAGYYNITRAFDVINTKVTVWKSQDMVLKRLLAEGTKAHPGWDMINSLVKKGYMYQAACELATLKTDRVKKDEIVNGDANDTFIHYESASKIFEALKVAIGEGKDKTLKTKAFPMLVSSLWGKLSAKFGDDRATEYFVQFIDGLAENKVKAIIEAKTKKGKPSRDEQRKQILEQEFYTFVGAHSLKI